MRQDSVIPASLNLNASFDDDGNEVNHRSLTRQVSVLDPSLIMNTLFDDSGCIIEEDDIQSRISVVHDPEYIATANAILNTRITSKESFIGRESRSSLLPTTVIEVSEVPLEVVDEFDEDLHFITALSFDSGPVVPVKRNSLLSFSTNII